MWWFEIGDFPNGVDEEDPEWRKQVLEWCKSYLEFCCDSPFSGYYIDGIATEEELAQGTSVSGEVPWRIALFYADGEEEEAEHYLEKCLVAYYRFCTAVDWVACQPTTLVSLFEGLGYDAPIGRVGSIKHPNHSGLITPDSSEALPVIDAAEKKYPWLRYINRVVDINDETALREAFQEALLAMEAAKNDCCTLELVRLPLILQEHEPNWHNWVVMWIRVYMDYTCGTPPSGTRIKMNWTNSTRWRTRVPNTQLLKPSKVICGWGLDWDGEESPPKTHDFAEKFRLAFYHLMTHVDWQQFDGEKLRSCFDEQGYNDYLKHI